MSFDTSKPGIPGVRFNEFGRAEIVLWAPLSEHAGVLNVTTGEKFDLEKQPYGYWTKTTEILKPGDLYQFRISDEKILPDPASLYQSQGVHGASEAVDLKDFSWADSGWANPGLKDYIIYEVHIGTFTDAGTLSAMEEKLDYLVGLGVNAIELMPVSQFAGARNWGYDGVFPYSVQDSYGGPKALQHFVNACHEKGLAVILDMVYNHLGPEGNVFGEFGHYFTDKYHTPWGDAINFDDAWSDAVRHYFVENAIMWFRDFHIDALRLDAVHAIKDFSPRHLLEEISARTEMLKSETGKQHFLIVEMDLNDTRFIKPREDGGYGMDAQWIDEFHHALRVSSGQQKTGYYSDFDPIASLAKSYRDAYVYDGQYSEHRKRRFGVSAAGFSGEHFIVFSQNHDHVGNRMLGERTSQLVSFEMQKLLAAAVLISPYVPLLFMGEEWAETNPFQYFVSHTDPKLADAVREGRKKEFAAFHMEGEAPDPVGEETFDQSKLQWDLPKSGVHKTMYEYYRELIRLRKQLFAGSVTDREGLEVKVLEGKEVIELYRNTAQGKFWAVLNFSKQSQQVVANQGNSWKKCIASGDLQWGGPETLADTLDNGQLTILPESFVLYQAS